MILPSIDPDRFLSLVRDAPVIAYQQMKHGHAIAAEGEAYYAPLSHPGGGNLMEGFLDRLGAAFVERVGTPRLRTLRPTAQPVMLPEFDVAQAAGDTRAMIENQTQIVITAIEEFNRPALKDAMAPLKLEAISEACVIVSEYVNKVIDEIDSGDVKARLMKLHLVQASSAMKSALTLLLEP